MKYLTGELKPQMPMGQPPLPAEQIELVRKWIQEGAKDDTPPEARETISLDKPIHLHAAAGDYVAGVFARRRDAGRVGLSRSLADSGEAPARPQSGLLACRNAYRAWRFRQDGALLVAAGGTPARFGEVQFWDVKDAKDACAPSA